MSFGAGEAVEIPSYFSELTEDSGFASVGRGIVLTRQSSFTLYYCSSIKGSSANPSRDEPLTLDRQFASVPRGTHTVYTTTVYDVTTRQSETSPRRLTAIAVQETACTEDDT